jgi:hypothetical protein
MMFSARAALLPAAHELCVCCEGKKGLLLLMMMVMRMNVSHDSVWLS